MKSHAFCFALLSVTAIVICTPAQAALLTRTFVSSAGSDSNPCTITQPCATFAHAYSLTAASGIVAALDPGKYGPLTITAAITINGNGWAAITAPSAGTGIGINAGTTDNIILTGLEIDGAGAASNGITLSSAGRLDVVGCVIRNFTHDGIYLQPTDSLFISILDTIASNNGNDGIDLSPSGSFGGVFGVVNRSTTTGNGTDGMNLWGANAGNPASDDAAVTIVNSVSSNNGQDGFVAHTTASNGIAVLTVRDSVADYNSGTGLLATGTGQLILAHNEATGNSFGIQIVSGATGHSFGDNHVYGNFSTDVVGTLGSASFH